MAQGINRPRVHFNELKTKSSKENTINIVLNFFQKLDLELPSQGTIEDVYMLAHEIADTFDLLPEEKDNETRNLLGEVYTECFELMLSQYLIENNIAEKQDR